MKSLTINLCALLLLGVFSARAETTIAGGEVSGKWTREASPYVVGGDLTIPKEAKLKIEPGVTVTFAGYYSLTVQGTLEAGERKSKLFSGKDIEHPTILFTADLESNPAGWSGLRFIGSDDDSYLSRVRIERARTQGSGGGIYCENAELNLAGCEIRDCAAAENGGAIAAIGASEVNLANVSLKDNRADGRGGAIDIADGELNLANVEIEGNHGGGIYADGCEVNLANVSISGNDGAGIAAERCRVNLANCSVSDNAGGGIHLVASELSMANANVSDAEHRGILARDASEISLVNCSVDGVDRDGGSTLTKLNTSIRD
ncbi:MAG: right-handed parallel beta-helix repeat-containing protein [bacterium]|nr:right-handed parallel beta-helix repeat-containing protein [bacterium]